MARAQKSLRVDGNLYERIRSLKEPGETEAELLNRIIAVGCDAVENEEYGADYVEAAFMNERLEALQARHDELLARHEEDKRALAEKDRQLAKVLDRTLELIEQSHVLVRMVAQGEEQPINELPAIVEASTEVKANKGAKPKKHKKKRKKKK